MIRNDSTTTGSQKTSPRSALSSVDIVLPASISITRQSPVSRDVLEQSLGVLTGLPNEASQTPARKPKHQRHEPMIPRFRLQAGPFRYRAGRGVAHQRPDHEPQRCLGHALPALKADGRTGTRDPSNEAPG